MINEKRQNGIFVSFEGIDGSGKSTQAKHFADTLSKKGIDVLTVRDPGSTPISESIRTLLLNKEYTDMSSWTELLLYEAARAQLVEETIKPALAQGKIVICDRFYDSTTAYQGYARHLNLDMVYQANTLGSCGLCPDYTFYIDVKPKQAIARKNEIKQVSDRMEAEGIQFQSRVRDGYLKIAKAYPRRFIVIDGSGPIDEIHQNILKIWKHFYEKQK